MFQSLKAKVLLVAASVAIVSYWVGAIPASSPRFPAAAEGEYPTPQPEAQGDGVETSCRLQMTPVLYDPAKGSDVRYVSFCVTFESSYAASSIQSTSSALIGCITALVDVDPDSITPIKSSIGGLDPGLGLPAGEPSPPAHEYEILIHPPEGKPWRATDASEVVVDVIRME